MNQNMDNFQFVVCLKNDGYEASLEPRKVYRVVSDSNAEAHQLLRVVDESGDDYLFPASYFIPIALPQSLVDALALTDSQAVVAGIFHRVVRNRSGKDF